MEAKSKQIILPLLRRDFDSEKYRSACADIIEVAIDVAGEKNVMVAEMISDFDCEFNEPYKKQMK